MRDQMLDAIATVVRMVRGAYKLSEAVSYAVVQYNLDEYEEEDLVVMSRNQLARLELQTGSAKS
jgi:hypothetical protein